MSKIHLMVGIPGCGKTTFVKENMCVGDVHVSRDAIRFSMVAEDEQYFSKEKEVFKEFIRQINEAIAANKDVWIDATHISVASRQKVLSQLNKKEDDKVWCHVISKPFSEVKAQNAQRTGREFVPVSALRRMNEQYEEPDWDEGFDIIHYI